MCAAIKKHKNPSSRKKKVSDNDEMPMPETRYFSSAEAFHQAVADDFIQQVNNVTVAGQLCLVGLSHGISPAGAYALILQQYHRLKHPDRIRYTFVNSQLPSQKISPPHILNASRFIQQLFKKGLINRKQILGSSLDRMSIEQYVPQFNDMIRRFLQQENKPGLDYVFLACNPQGRVAGIERQSPAFSQDEIASLIPADDDWEMTATPWFLLQSARIAFLATKADKRRPLAWLYSEKPQRLESPGFLRFLPEIEKRLCVFMDDHALTWPQIEITRETPYGSSIIRIDTAIPFNEKEKDKKPVLLLLHGFLGLNSFDGLLAGIPTHQVIACALHYGSIPNDLPPAEYSEHITRNIEATIAFFGQKGHPVYFFDHSMGNIYLMMIEKRLEKYPLVKKYLCGRIAANPFFGSECKHAILGFMDNVIIPSLSLWSDLSTKSLMLSMRAIIPLDSKKSVRRRSIHLTEWLIRKESAVRDSIWSAVKKQILYLMSALDAMPHLNRIPIEQALNRLPAKVFAIQVHSALLVSLEFDNHPPLQGFAEAQIPVLVLKSDRDGVARFVPEIYNHPKTVIRDVTRPKEKDLFREHLYHMVCPAETIAIIDHFITACETTRKGK
jgi:hypothetical protein